MKIENIKFKAKRLDNGEWVEGNLIRSTAGVKERAYIVDAFSSMCDYSVVGIDPFTVCMFTGLKDCKGNEVWEGDVIKDPYLGKKCTIEWNNHLCSFTALDEINSSDKPLGALVKSLGWYVVGNKFNKNNV